jgi:two-component system nitrogen regulation sensor histidine kinase NtrY
LCKLTINEHIVINNRIKLGIFAASILLATAISAFYTLSGFYILWAILILIRLHATRYEEGELDIISYVSILLICSWIAAVQLNHFQSVKELGIRKQLVKQLDNGDDPRIARIFKNVESKIVKDPFLKSYFKNGDHNAGYLKDRFERFYFDGYLSDYNCKIHEFNSKGVPISADSNYVLNDFKDMVMFSSFKVSEYFYRENDNFGFHSYFAILPVYQHDVKLGTVVVELKSKPVQANTSFPELLVDSQLVNDHQFKDYSYAFYSDGQLVSQSGVFDYNVANTELKGKLKQYVFKTTAERYDNKPWLHGLTKYNHLIYQPSLRKVIVVSKPENNWLTYLASLTFFYVWLLFCCLTGCVNM